MNREYWLFNSGIVMQMVRTNTGFLDVVNGAAYSKDEFLQYVQGCNGHLITEEAFQKIVEGQRTHDFLE